MAVLDVVRRAAPVDVEQRRDAVEVERPRPGQVVDREVVLEVDHRRADPAAAGRGSRAAAAASTRRTYSSGSQTPHFLRLRAWPTWNVGVEARRARPPPAHEARQRGGSRTASRSCTSTKVSATPPRAAVELVEQREHGWGAQTGTRSSRARDPEPVGCAPGTVPRSRAAGETAHAERLGATGRDGGASAKHRPVAPPDRGEVARRCSPAGAGTGPRRRASPRASPRLRQVGVRLVVAVVPAEVVAAAATGCPGAGWSACWSGPHGGCADARPSVVGLSVPGPGSRASARGRNGATCLAGFLIAEPGPFTAGGLKGRVPRDDPFIHGRRTLEKGASARGPHQRVYDPPRPTTERGCWWTTVAAWPHQGGRPRRLVGEGARAVRQAATMVRALARRATGSSSSATGPELDGDDSRPASGTRRPATVTLVYAARDERHNNIRKVNAQDAQNDEPGRHMDKKRYSSCARPKA